MAFIVEDGTGKPDATSFALETDFDAYWTDRNNATLVALGATVKRAQLIMATDYLRNTSRYDWTGVRKSVAQRLPWPRTGAYERRVGVLPDTTVPRAVLEAACYLASIATSPEALQPALAHGGAVASEAVGDLHTAYFKGASLETVLTVIDGLLVGLTRRVMTEPLPQRSNPDDISALFTGLSIRGGPEVVSG